jgi:two-component system LytT family response regulator
MFGHKVAQRIQHQPLIVFATAFDTYAMTAFELRAVDYLLKPYGRQRFAQAMERVRLVADSLEARRSMAGRVAEASGHEVSRLHVRDRGGIRSIPVDAVSRIESSDDYASIHVGVASYLLYARLTELAALLEPAGFVRIHRSHLINLAFLDRVDPEGNGRYSVQLTTGEKLPVSRSGGKILMAAIRR